MGGHLKICGGWGDVSLLSPLMTAMSSSSPLAKCDLSFQPRILTRDKELKHSHYNYEAIKVKRRQLLIIIAWTIGLLKEL